MRDKPLIIGEGKMPEAAAFHDVQTSCAEWPELVLAPHVAGLFREEIPEGSVLYNLEPLYDNCRSFSLGYLDVLRQFPVVDYQRKNVEYLAQHGIDAVHMPYGFHESMRRTQNVEKDIDVLFFGSFNDRRKPLLAQFMNSEMNVRVVCGCYGALLDNLISRSKIHINIHYCDDHPLEVVRLNYLLANACFVISERGWDDVENEVYQLGVVFAEYSDIIEQCKHYLVHESERNDAVKKGVQIVQARPQSAFIKKAKLQIGVQ